MTAIATIAGSKQQVGWATARSAVPTPSFTEPPGQFARIPRPIAGRNGGAEATRNRTKAVPTAHLRVEATLRLRLRRFLTRSKAIPPDKPANHNPRGWAEAGDGRLTLGLSCQGDSTTCCALEWCSCQNAWPIRQYVATHAEIDSWVRSTCAKQAASSQIPQRTNSSN